MLDRDRMIQILDNHRDSKHMVKYKGVDDAELLRVFNNAVRDLLYIELRDGWVGVKFLKVSGEERNMVCTLAPRYLPPKEHQVADGEVAATKRKRNEDVIAVWDRDQEGWRSFRLDSIEQVWKLEPIIVEKVI